VKRKVRARWRLGLALGVASCAGRTPFAGVRVALDVDPSLAATPVTELSVSVGSIDGGATYRPTTYYPVDDSGARGSTRFPTSFAIASNGNPKAAVAFTLAIYSGARPIDEERYEVVNVPATRLADLRVLFAASCPARSPGGPAVGCPLDGACTWQGDFWLCDAARFPNAPADGGWPALGAVDASDGGARDAQDASDEGHDATVDDASDLDAADLDAAEPDTADDQTPEIDAPPGIPCDAGCGAGEECVAGWCVPLPPSCGRGAPGAGHDCGRAGNDDCCASDEVEGGTYYRDDDTVANFNTSAPATVSPFRLDRYEVTVGRFRQFVGAAPWTPDAGDGKHRHLNGGSGLSSGGDAGITYETGWNPLWNQYVPKSTTDWDAALLIADCNNTAIPYDVHTWTPDAGTDDAGATSNERLPINCITWYAAYAFCIWDGGFLPSDAEWGYAAGGGDQQRAFAWGSKGPYSNPTFAIYNCYYPPSTNGGAVCIGIDNVAQVGSAPAGQGRWGQMDLTGSVYEYDLDYYAPSLALPCTDCANTASGTQRCLRGGGWASAASQIYNAFTTVASPGDVHIDVGVRCARTPNP
jgi:formylglycine-generating enzyme required for sulfatase activity